GLGLAEWQPEAEQPIPDSVLALAEQRQAARAAKNWAAADALRDQIAAAGYDITDTPSGPELRRSAAHA
ncbi:MAG: hypothetical protein KC449_03975, partial [Anaerolineales bacterium]|nr:hypothetical protein [Anaerolineales bacterium]